VKHIYRDIVLKREDYCITMVMLSAKFFYYCSFFFSLFRQFKDDEQKEAYCIL